MDKSRLDSLGQRVYVYGDCDLDLSVLVSNRRIGFVWWPAGVVAVVGEDVPSVKEERKRRSGDEMAT
jgi:hypothetical protein